ncbi:MULTISPECIES: hypothetical protein [Pseudoalteromonas]|uniref:hypothetical protein n=1 Tax=Pseudoalteromonas TaxID=53246 RepID=UPI001594485B|nr:MULTISPECIES: hypothetical protein [Pseudoalteromonas]MDP4982946.1 hypothetical protein [Pseudoalteromonas tunicata]MDP5212317.1 hypothetical protein [Pseudoalteromonas tunicata]
MWHKTFAGFLSGIIVMILIPSIISLWFPAHINLFLAISLVVSLTAWAGVMTWCYGAETNKQAWLRAAKLALPTLLIFVVTFFIAAGPSV